MPVLTWDPCSGICYKTMVERQSATSGLPDTTSILEYYERLRTQRLSQYVPCFPGGQGKALAAGGADRDAPAGSSSRGPGTLGTGFEFIFTLNPKP